MSTDRTQIVRVVTMRSRPGQEEAAVPVPGEMYCLVEHRSSPWSSPQSRRWDVLDPDPRTNMDRQPLWEGWLRCTDDVSAYAMGAYRVVSVHAHRVPDGADDTRYRMSLAPAEKEES